MNFDIATLPYLEVWKRRARWRRRTSRPVSRVLCLDVLHVERRPSISTCRHRQALAVYPQTRAGRPRTPAQAGEPTLLDLAPGGVYRAAPVTRNAGGLLHRRFTLTSDVRAGGLFSVALSRGSPRVAVGNHPALWSPDFPRRGLATSTRPSGRLVRRVAHRRRHAPFAH